MLLYIKNMVCQRCITTIKSELEKLGLMPINVTLGEVSLQDEEISVMQLEKLDGVLNGLGFERIDDKKAKIIEDIKSTIIQIIHHQNKLELKVNWSDLLRNSIGFEYSYLSCLFSSVEGMTIEQYLIRQKIEKTKELLKYDELSLSEIAYKLGYSSVAHISNQFKKVTGLTPSEFKKNYPNARKSIDKV